MMKRLILVLLCGVAMSVRAQQADSVLAVARRVNDYFMRKWPDPTTDTFVGRRRPSSLWTRAVYYEGLMALYSIDPKPAYLRYVDQWANYHKWTPRNGTRTTNADDQCCMQTYLERFSLPLTPPEGAGGGASIDSCLLCMNRQMAEGRTDCWTWIDAIQMAMPAYAKAYGMTGDERYILFARDCYDWARNTCGGGLWNKNECLWWRDADFTPPYKERDGQNCYWSRGNGWVVAAIVRTLDAISEAQSISQHAVAPSAQKKAEIGNFRKELQSDYKAMMQALLRCQRDDGFWNVSLLSPSTYGGPETSGTALFLYGMAWGIRQGILPETSYRKAIEKAWQAIAHRAIRPDGFIGYVQGTGKEPKDGQPVTYDKVPDFEDYGAGCVLLACTEIYKVKREEQSVKNQSRMAEDESSSDSSPLTLSPPLKSNVPSAVKTGARWWWPGSAVTEEGLKWQMQQLASRGIGTLEITPIYGAKDGEKSAIPFLSERWMQMLDFAVREGKRIGIQIDMNLGTGWPFGSPETPLSEAACKLVVVDTLVDKKLAKTFIPLAPQKEKSYARLLLRKDFQSSAKGKRRVLALYESRTRQMVKRAAPGGEGYVIDHFDSTAVAHYLDRFDRAFSLWNSKNNSVSTLLPATFFNDSYEVYRADWTPSLLREFKKRRGYRLEDKLEQFVDGDADVLSDYRETLSDLLLHNFTEQWTRWSHERGVMVRNQAHGSPGNLIDLYAAVDVPEIEGFGLSEFGIKGLRSDSGMTRRNFSDYSMLKYASSAAHITGKKLVSSESFTWLTEHFRTSLSQMKPDLDLLFCSGVNRVFFHGTCYSPPDEPWPGWRFYASVDMSPANSIWRDAKMLTDYIQFCQERLQAGEPDNDFLVLLPIRNMWRTNLDKRLMQFEINAMRDKSPEFINTVLRIDSLGYDCDYISERYLLRTTFSGGRLQTEAGTRYAALILPPRCIMSKAVERHVERLRRQGAHIIYNVAREELERVAKPEELRTTLRLKTIRRRVGEGFRYFVANLTRTDVSQTVCLAATGQSVGLCLRSGESCFIEAPTNGKTSVVYPVKALQPLDSQSTISSHQFSTIADLTGNRWRLRFVESHPAPARSITLDSLQTWESLPVDSLSELMGTGIYETSFRLTAADVAAGCYRIDLGDVRESARVYINGTYVGCAWCVPFTLDFNGLLREGDNKISIEVTNLPANRIAAYDRRGINWRKMSDINVVDINYKPTSYAHWKPMPSGLNSYVRISKISN